MLTYSQTCIRGSETDLAAERVGERSIYKPGGEQAVAGCGGWRDGTEVDAITNMLWIETDELDTFELSEALNEIPKP